MRRWSTIWLVTILVATMFAAPAAAQYADVLLPQGVLQATIEDQPINAVTSPVSPVANPRIGGSLAQGSIVIELALADEAGGVIRFQTEVNQRGAFRQRPPEALEPGGVYTLYINDVMIGQFSVSPDATGGADRAATSDELDLARLIPFPHDAGGAIPNLGLVPELSHYQTIGELARQVAQNAGDTSREAREQAQAELEASGFVQRYQSSLAVPSEEDPGVFEIQIAAIVTEYAASENAEAAFAASSTSGETVESAAFGDESRMSSQSAVATQTGAEFQSLQVVFRQDRLLIVINYADLLNRAPEQAVLEAIAQAVELRAAAVLAGEAPVLTPKSLDMNLSGVPRTSAQEYYEAIDGSMVLLYGESQRSINAREANYAGTTDVSLAGFVSRGTGETTEADPESPPMAPFSYTTSIYSFPSADDATAWLAGLGERLSADPLPGYLSFAAVADAPAYGDASATYAFSRRLAGGTAEGFRVYVQVGTEVAAVELAAVPEAPFASVEPLVVAQVECLTEGTCAAVADPPGIEAVPGATDEADEAESAPEEEAEPEPASEEEAEPEAETETESRGGLPAGIEREPPSEEDESE